jgi:hypothetical protein
MRPHVSTKCGESSLQGQGSRTVDSRGYPNAVGGENCGSVHITTSFPS